MMQFHVIDNHITALNIKQSEELKINWLISCEGALINTLVNQYILWTMLKEILSSDMFSLRKLYPSYASTYSHSLLGSLY